MCLRGVNDVGDGMRDHAVPDDTARATATACEVIFIVAGNIYLKEQFNVVAK